MSSKSPGMSLRATSKGVGPTPTKRRNSTLWSESLDVHQKSTFSTKEIKRQEVECSGLEIRLERTKKHNFKLGSCIHILLGLW